MSYDMYLVDPVTKETLETTTEHFMTGGTYAVGGTKEMWLNITYNYGEIFRKVMGKDGIHKIEGMQAVDSIPILQNAIDKLKDDVDSNYWNATEGNAKRALVQLLALAKMRPDGEWYIT